MTYSYDHRSVTAAWPPDPPQQPPGMTDFEFEGELRAHEALVKSINFVKSATDKIARQNGFVILKSGFVYGADPLLQGSRSMGYYERTLQIRGFRNGAQWMVLVTYQDDGSVNVGNSDLFLSRNERSYRSAARIAASYMKNQPARLG